MIERLSEFTIKAGGLEASGKVRPVEAAALLGAATVRKSESGAAGVASGEAEILAGAREITALFGDLQERRRNKPAWTPRVLWVDDTPANNMNEQSALEALGIAFVHSRSTEDALDKLSQQAFDAVISDLVRASDPQAGHTLLKALREKGDTTPFIIYTFEAAPVQRAESRALGAQGRTNRPQELFALLLTTLRAQSAAAAA